MWGGRRIQKGFHSTHLVVERFGPRNGRGMVLRERGAQTTSKFSRADGALSAREHSCGQQLPSWKGSATSRRREVQGDFPIFQGLSRYLGGTKK